MGVAYHSHISDICAFVNLHRKTPLLAPFRCSRASARAFISRTQLRDLARTDCQTHLALAARAGNPGRVCRPRSPTENRGRKGRSSGALSACRTVSYETTENANTEAVTNQLSVFRRCNPVKRFGCPVLSPFWKRPEYHHHRRHFLTRTQKSLFLARYGRCLDFASLSRRDLPPSNPRTSYLTESQALTSDREAPNVKIPPGEICQ